VRAVELWAIPWRSRRGHDLRPDRAAFGAADVGHGSGRFLSVSLSTEFSLGGVAARAVARLARLACAGRGQPAALSLRDGWRELALAGAGCRVGGADHGDRHRVGAERPPRRRIAGGRIATGGRAPDRGRGALWF